MAPAEGATMDHRTAANARAMRSKQSGTYRLSSTPRPRRLVALMAAITLAFGGSLMAASTASAAPGDPVIFADQNLEDAVNDELGQNSGDTITEAQAASITELDAGNLGISNLAGIEYLVGLTELDLVNNSVAVVSSLSGLTNLEVLNLGDNNISNIAPLSSLENLRVLRATYNDISNISVVADLDELTTLHIGHNVITDISAVSGLANLVSLHAEGNNITDISALSGLTNMHALRVDSQTVNLPATVTSASTANPVVDVDGNFVPVSSSDTGFAYNSTSHTWTFTAPGAKTLTWNTPVTVGDTTVDFSGTINQDIGQAPLVPATAQDPEVVQAFCSEGDVVGPQVNLPTTEGIEYEIEGDVEPGATVTVRAIPADDSHSIVVNPDSDWVGNSDRLYATLEITLDAVDCAAPPAADETVTDDAGLLRTGGNPATTLFGALGALIVLTGTGLVAVRRRFIV